MDWVGVFFGVAFLASFFSLVLNLLSGSTLFVLTGLAGVLVFWWLMDWNEKRRHG